ncbi:MAG: hypothetical protein ACE5EG_09420 [Thermoanaerobaculia bacterium]
MPDRTPPRYPELRVSIRSRNPLALVAAVREELRLAGAGHGDISRFTDQALARPDRRHVLAVAEEWIGAVEAA